jgi:hypothetical protein
MGLTPPRESSMDTSITAGVWIVLATGIAILTGFPTWTIDQAEQLLEFEFRFLAGEQIPEHNIHARITAQPPHWYWGVNRNVYGCAEVEANEDDLAESAQTPGFVSPNLEHYFEDRLGPMISCHFTIPVEWGCAWIELDLVGSYPDTTADLIETPWGSYYPSVRVSMGPHPENLVLVGECPDPPLQVIELPEPSFRTGLLIAMMTLLIAGKMRRPPTA